MASITSLPTYFQRRVINSPTLEVFTWDKFSFSTEYIEPFGVARAGNNSSIVTKQFKLPQRKFELEFSTMYYLNADYDKYWMHELEISFDRLRNFYDRHGTHRRFILNHPIYGDCVCRFYEPLEIPKKNKNGLGSLESFKLVMFEEVTRHYYLDPLESEYSDITFEFPYAQTVVKYPSTSAPLALGNNYIMVVRDRQKPLRTFQLTLPALVYKNNEAGDILFSTSDNLSVLQLELFYLNKRLDKEFIFNYEGEDIFVKFNKAIAFPTIKGNRGVLQDIQIELLESRGSLQVTEPPIIPSYPDPCALTTQPYPLYLDETLTNNFKLDLSLTREALNKTNNEEEINSSINMENVLIRSPINNTESDTEELNSNFSLDGVYFRSIVNRGSKVEEEINSNFSLDNVYWRNPLNRTTLDIDKITSTFSLDGVYFRSVVNKTNTTPESLGLGISVLNSQITYEVRYLSASVINTPDSLGLGISVLNSQITYEVRYLSTSVINTPDSLGLSLQVLNSKITYEVGYLSKIAPSGNIGLNLQILNSQITQQVRYLNINMENESIDISITVHDSQITG